VKPLVAAVMLAASAAACVSGVRVRSPAVSAQSSGSAALRDALAPHYQVIRPEGGGPFPLLVFVPGCSGFEHPRAPAHYRLVADRLRARGWSVLFVDYVRARGVPEACRGVMSPREVGQYVSAAVGAARTMSFVDSLQIAVVGWSLGAGGVMAALTTADAGMVPVRSVIALYPDCTGLTPWQTSIPTLVLLAGRDSIQPPERCERVTAQVRAPGNVSILAFPTAHHGFDMQGLPSEPIEGLPALAYDRASAEVAWREIERFLEAHRSRP